MTYEEFTARCDSAISGISGGLAISDFADAEWGYLYEQTGQGEDCTDAQIIDTLASVDEIFNEMAILFSHPKHQGPSTMQDFIDRSLAARIGRSILPPLRLASVFASRQAWAGFLMERVAVSRVSGFISLSTTHNIPTGTGGNTAHIIRMRGGLKHEPSGKDRGRNRPRHF